MPVFSAPSPLTCVAYGSGKALDHIDQLGPSTGTAMRSRGALVPERV
jgi:actin-like ATPase involved in cell morphogenesis